MSSHSDNHSGSAVPGMHVCACGGTGHLRCAPKYVGGAENTVPFEEAPTAVIHALEVIKTRMKQASLVAPDFNEVLTAAYMEKQKMAVRVLILLVCDPEPRFLSSSTATARRVWAPSSPRSRWARPRTCISASTRSTQPQSWERTLREKCWRCTFVTYVPTLGPSIAY